MLPRDPGGPAPVAQGLQLTLHAVSDGFGPLGDLVSVVHLPTQLLVQTAVDDLLTTEIRPQSRYFSPARECCIRVVHLNIEDCSEDLLYASSLMPERTRHPKP